MKTAIVAALCCLVFFIAGGAAASDLTLIDSGICTEVANHSAVDIEEVFGSDIGILFCFTRVVGPYLEGNEQFIEHVWYYQDTERARVALPVKSSNWGTYSSKKIQPFEIGNWRVEVCDSQGETIDIFQFYIKE